MNNGITFDISNGPVMDGTWVNLNTSDIFTVREAFFQDNQYLIQTTDGRLLDCNFIQDYIKVDNEKTAREMLSTDKKHNIETMPPEVANLIESNNANDSNDDYSNYIIPEDKDLINGKSYLPQYNINTGKEFIKSNNDNIIYEEYGENPINQIENEDLLFIKRVLKNIEIPNLDIQVDWKTIPISKLDTLINILGVDVDNIADWIMKDIDIMRIKNDIKLSIRDKIQACVGGSDEKPKEPSPVKKSSPVKKTRRSVNEK